MTRTYPLEEILLPMGGTTVKDDVKMEEIWNDPSYIVEEKYDGSRYLSKGGRFFSRRISVKDGLPVEKTENVPHLQEVLKKYPFLILDGEVYIEGAKSNDVVSIMGASESKALWRQGFGEYVPPVLEGSKGKWRLGITHEWVEVPKKEVVELYTREGSLQPIKYVVFDILRDIDGNWLTDLPWIDRRGILEEQLELLFEDCPSAKESISISAYATKDKKEFHAAIMLRGGEGTMLKDINGKYFPDKKPRWNWIKVKSEITSDVIITGFKDAVREYDPLRPELLLDWEYWEELNGDLVTRGQVAMARQDLSYEDVHLHLLSLADPVTKFYFHGWIGAIEFSQYTPEGVLKQVGYCSGLTEQLRKDVTDNPDKYLNECMEISAMERTKDGYFRHPQYLRMRPDKNAKDCVMWED